VSAVEIVALACVFCGSALLLAGARAFARAPLAERLRPYVPAVVAGREAPGRAERGTVAAVLLPAAESFGRRLSGLTGVVTDLPTRLRRAGRDESASQFRLRQFTVTLVALAAATAAVLSLRPGLVLSVVALVAAPVLAALREEQRLDGAGARRAEVLAGELPVVAEQLGILLGAGYSLAGALGRLSRRGSGVAATDLRDVVRRIRSGADEDTALRAWADEVDVPAVERLVSVLSLHREAGDLGALITEEAHAIRAEDHRRLLESIEKRSQMVWVPVTVATLVPGLLLLSVPFMAAMDQVTGG
jgi:Flp pilus assembly protein TadB